MGIRKIILLIIILSGNAAHAQEVVTNITIQSSLIDSSNNLLIAGYGLINDSTLEVGIARYDSNGSIDTTFNSAGYNIQMVGTRAEANAMGIQSTGDVIIAGFTSLSNITQALLLRFTSSGILDTTFGSSGIIAAQIGDGATIFDVAIQSNDYIIAAGVSNQVGVPELLVARYTASGSLDTTFNSSGTTPGIVTTQIGSRTIGFGTVIDSSGNIVVTGMTFINGQSQFYVARYTSLGVLDTTFGTGGYVTTPIGTISQANDVAIDSSGNIVVAGFADTNLAIARYTSAGLLDTTFNSSGTTPGVVTTAVGNKTQANSLLLDASGNIVAGGFSDSDMLLARYTSSGVLDTTFGSSSNGIVTVAIETTNICTSVVLQGTDIIASGYADADTLILRFNSSGLVDITWGINGVVNQPGNSNYFTNIWEAESTGTNGGTFTSGAWQTRVLNAITTINNAVTLNSNQFTLNPGIYTIGVNAPAYQVDNHQIRLQNVTDSLTTLYGTSSFSSSSGGTTSYSLISGQFIISKQTTFEIQHMCATTQTSDGFGVATGFGNDEMYTNVKITSNFSF